MTVRAARAEVRNPVMALPAVASLASLPAESRDALRQILKSIAADAGDRAQKSWRTHKAPMALYWKAVSVYAKHIARAIPSREAA